MANHSIAEAKNGLPGLIDKARAGEQVIITRHGRPVAELRPIGTAQGNVPPRNYAWLKAQRAARKSVNLTSTELLRRLYEEGD